MLYQNDIINLQTNIKDKIGRKIIVKGSQGRGKFFEKEATIEKAYSSTFMVKYEGNERNVSYQYKDVFDGTVEVDIFDGESYSPLIPPIVNTPKRIRTSLG